MLKELWSDKFLSNGIIRNKIIFNDNLNVVLGADDAANSIGKSTFLMIIDFVFGGDDYVEKANYIIINVGHHSINFMFQFGNEKMYFSRNTENYKKVFICNQNYSSIDEIDIEKYRKLLFDKYSIDLPHISFRNIVSRYLRIYGRDNSNEKRPLHVMPNEKTGEPVNSLIKLFNKYDSINNFQKEVTEASEIKSAYSKAQKYTFVPNINKTTYAQNIFNIRKLELELDQLQYVKEDLIDTSAVHANEFIKLKNEYSKLKRARTSLYNEYEIVNRKILFSSNQSNYEALSHFFENVNFKHLNEINNFHSQIYEILSNEFEEAKEKIQINIDDLTDKMADLEKLMEATGYNRSVPKSMVQRITAISTSITRMKNENNQFDQSNEYKITLETKTKNLQKVRKNITSELEIFLNTKMDKINDYIYKGDKTPPKLTFLENNDYTFEIINDSGTGSRYRGMLIFDLVVLGETVLPVVVHDSFLFKNIEDHAIEAILQIYTNINKQIFISLDKINSYSNEAQNILKSNEVIYLSPEGNELFGRSWNKKKKQ